MTCTTCGRDLSSRECSNPEHRIARGFDPDARPSDSLVRQCPKCRKTKPTSKFWDRRSGRRYVSCGECRFNQRNFGKAALGAKAAWRRELAEANAFWDSQAANNR